MKNLSLLLNIILLIAVGVLYYLYFSGKKASGIKSKSPIAFNSNGAHPQIAYVDLDSLNEKITFIKNNKKSLEAEQMAIETEWENGYRNLEAQKNNFLKKGESITQQQAEGFQAYLSEQQQSIDSKKQSLTQKLNEKSYKFMDGIQKELKKFLEEYNESKAFTYIFTTGSGLDYMVYKDSSLNITQDVIEGMNEKLNANRK
jgi:outer membrane protein